MFIFKHFRTRLESNLLTHFAMRYSVRWKTLSDPVPTHSHKIQEWTHTFRKPFLSVFFTDTLGKWQQKQWNIIAMDFFPPLSFLISRTSPAECILLESPVLTSQISSDLSEPLILASLIFAGEEQELLQDNSSWCLPYQYLYHPQNIAILLSLTHKTSLNETPSI